MTSITTLCFDIGNTLLSCDPSPAEIYAEALSRFGRPVTAEQVDPVFAGAWAQLQKQSPAGIDRYGSHPGGERMWWGAFLCEVLSRLDHDAQWEPLLDELYASFSRPEVWKLYPEARETLEESRRRGLRLAVISNWDRRLPEILDGLELTAFFDTISVSSIEGVEKPAPVIFERTLERLGVHPEEAVHIGDSPLEDYDGSKRVGMVPVLIDRPDAFASNGYRRISNLAEVFDLLE